MQEYNWRGEGWEKTIKGERDDFRSAVGRVDIEGGQVPPNRHRRRLGFIFLNPSITSHPLVSAYLPLSASTNYRSKTLSGSMHGDVVFDLHERRCAFPLVRRIGCWNVLRSHLWAKRGSWNS